MNQKKRKERATRKNENKKTKTCAALTEPGYEDAISKSMEGSSEHAALLLADPGEEERGSARKP